MFSITISNGTSFTQREGETILFAAEESGVVLPYSCRTGRCSSCKCKVVSGNTIPVADELGLSKEEIDGGWILSCVRSVTNKAEIEIDDLGDLHLPKPGVFPCKIDAVEEVTENVVSVRMRLPPASKFSALAGQYVDIIGPAGVRRSYSIANLVTDNILEFHIRKVDNGALSSYWFGEAKRNDLLRLRGPLGTFFLRPMKGKDLIFLATGTGVAPIKAMCESLRFLEPEDSPETVTVYWGGRNLDDLYLDPSEIYPTIRFVPVLSRPSDTWQGIKGYVQDALVRESWNLSNCVVYACGSEAMICGAHEVLLERGLAENNFFSDVFLSSAPI